MSDLLLKFIASLTFLNIYCFPSLLVGMFQAEMEAECIECRGRPLSWSPFLFQMLSAQTSDHLFILCFYYCGGSFFSVCMLGQTFKHRTLLQLALANAGVLGTEQAHHWNLTQRPLHSRYKSQLWWNKRDVSREQPGKCDHLHCKRGKKKKTTLVTFWTVLLCIPFAFSFSG